MAVGAAILLLAPPWAAPGQEAAQFFRQNCGSCHTVGGGRLTGPDLQGLDERKDRAWLTRFLLDPPAVLQSGDPYAAQIQQESRGVVMPKIAGMTEERAAALLDLIAAESKLEKSQFAGLVLSDKPFTPADVHQGREYFLGRQRLTNGGASCMSCHSVRDAGALGGGRLGPDLSRVYERLQGRKALAAWLSAPATPTMKAAFVRYPLEADEIHVLTAYFEASAQRGGEDDRSGSLAFFLLGLGAAAVMLVAMDSVWRGRFRSVRRVLVHGRLEQAE
jgi:mono/diheme cytochrome c family protein